MYILFLNIYIIIYNLLNEFYYVIIKNKFFFFGKKIMCKVGIFFGSDTGNTKRVSYYILEKFSKYFDTSILNIANSSVYDFYEFDILILGTSTWYCGELQYDWDDFLYNFKSINFSNKIISFFGCGNQEDYGDYFCSGIYKLYKIVIKDNPIILGYWPVCNYKFIYSKSLLNKSYFFGLVLDEDYQSEFTIRRVNIWTSKLLLDIFNYIK